MRGAACNNCNLQFQSPSFIPVYFHNLSGYDAHLFVKELKGRLGVIANNSENYISFNKFLKVGEKKIEIRFLDSFRLMPSSLDSLAKNLPDSEKKNLKKKFNTGFSIVNQKGIYPYEWVDSFEKFQATELHSKKDFYSKLNNTEISDSDYQHAQNVWKEFDCKTFRDYHQLYLETDVLLLADVLENFRETCMKNYSLDPAWFYTSPSLLWQAMLKMTGIRLELLTDSEMYMFFEQGIRGGICMASHRHAKANNPSVSDYKPDKEKSYITYLDANNLYGLAMSKNLPYKNFRWMRIEDCEKWMNMPCTLEVDLEYPEELFELHNAYPLAPEHIITSETNTNKN